MTIKDHRLGLILSRRNPGVEGIETKDGRLTRWPPSLGVTPTDTQLQQWIAEFDALPPDDKAKNPKANFIKRLRQANTIAGIKLILEEWVESQ